MADDFTTDQDIAGEQPLSGPMDDATLRYVTDQEINDSYDWCFGKIAQERATAESYYLGLPTGDLAASPIPDRSAYVSTDVEDTVEWMLPALVEIFTAGDDVVEFSATKQADEPAAAQTTDVVNHVFYQMNPGWQVLYTWFKDTLIQKNGIVKAWWDPTPKTVREEYRGLTDIQLAMILMDNSVKPVEHSAYPDAAALQAAQVQYQQAMQHYKQVAQQPLPPAQPGMPPPQPPQPPQPPSPQSIPQLHDIAIIRTTASGQVCVENVPPEEFLISRKSKRITDGFSGHRVRRTISYLRQQGYANVDDITSDEMPAADMSQEAITRRSLEDAPYRIDDGNGDESMREVWLTECYMPIDYDGDGIAEWRKIVRAGNGILENVPIDGPPFASLCAVPLPHLFFGRSPAEQAMPTQRLKTTIWRGMIDNMQMLINGRTYAVNGEVNLDDLLSNRPNGVVRVKGPQSVGPLQQGMTNTASVAQLLEMADQDKQDRTGVMKLTQGSDADIMNETAAGNAAMTDRSNQRIKLIARIFAETGVKDLFILIQKLLAQYQDRAMTMKLRGEWVDVDPRAWKNDYAMTVNVGLGTGDKTKAIQHVTMLGQAQAQALQIGVATPTNIYNTLSKLPPLLGYKNAEEFFTDPSKQPPQQPKPDPKLQQIQAKGQQDMQIEQMRQQFDSQKAQSDQQLEILKAHLDQQTAVMQQRAQAEQSAQETQIEAQRDLLQAHLEQQNQRMQMAFDAHMEAIRQAVAVQIAQIGAASRVEVAETAAATTLQSAQISAANQASRPEEQ